MEVRNRWGAGGEVRSGFGALAPCERQNNDLASRERDWKGEVEEGERKENESLFLEGQ